jgi:hypothetical protein
MRESKSASSLFSHNVNGICYLAASHFQSAEAIAMEIPISFHEVAKFLPSHPFRGSHLLSSRDVFDKINEPIRASERKSFGSSLLLCKLAC